MLELPLSGRKPEPELELVGRGILGDLICVVCVHVDYRRLKRWCGEVVDEIHPEARAFFSPKTR